MVDRIRNLHIGDLITVKESVQCYYYDYPRGSGRNLVTFDPGDETVIVRFPAKVCDYSHDGSDYFVYFEAKGQRFGTSWRNVKKVRAK